MNKPNPTITKTEREQIENLVCPYQDECKYKKSVDKLIKLFEKKLLAVQQETLERVGKEFSPMFENGNRGRYWAIPMKKWEEIKNDE